MPQRSINAGHSEGPTVPRDMVGMVAVGSHPGSSTYGWPIATRSVTIIVDTTF